MVRVELTGEFARRRVNPFDMFLLDAAQAGGIDPDRLAKLSGLPVDFIRDRLKAAEKAGWIDTRGRITTEGETTRLGVPEFGQRTAWMALCRRTGRVLPAVFEGYPKGTRSEDPPIVIPPADEGVPDELVLQLGLRRAWDEHDRRRRFQDDCGQSGVTDLVVDDSDGDEHGDDGDVGGPSASDKGRSERRPSKGPKVRALGRPQWGEARLELWAEVDPTLPPEHAVTVSAGCPVGWVRDGHRYLRQLERTEPGRKAIAILLEEGKERYHDRMAEAIDARWQQDLANEQRTIREGLGLLPPRVDRELSELVVASLRATRGRDRLRTPLGALRVVTEQVLLTLVDDPDLATEAKQAWETAAPRTKLEAGLLGAKLATLLPEDDEGRAFVVPPHLKSALSSWARSRPFATQPTHGQALLLHPFALAALAPHNPAAIRLRAALGAERELLKLLDGLMRSSNRHHHATGVDEQKEVLIAEFREGLDVLRRVLCACFPLVTVAAQPPNATASESLDASAYDGLNF